MKKLRPFPFPVVFLLCVAPPAWSEPPWKAYYTKDHSKCLDVHAPAQWTNGAHVQVWDCNGEIQQQWKFIDGTIRSRAGKCLDVHAPEQYKNGARLQVWDCNGSRQQRWKLRHIGEPSVSIYTPYKIVSGAGKCLTVDGKRPYPAYHNGARVTVWDCNDITKRDEQEWHLTPHLETLDPGSASE
jgi:hypothetical protein